MPRRSAPTGRPRGIWLGLRRLVPLSPVRAGPTGPIDPVTARRRSTHGTQGLSRHLPVVRRPVRLPGVLRPAAAPARRRRAAAAGPAGTSRRPRSATPRLPAAAPVEPAEARPRRRVNGEPAEREIVVETADVAGGADESRRPRPALAAQGLPRRRRTTGRSGPLESAADQPRPFSLACRRSAAHAPAERRRSTG